jgi:hypothetical protein
MKPSTTDVLRDDAEMTGWTEPVWLEWTDPVSQYESLATAVRILAEGRSTFSQRMDEATFALTRWQVEDFPQRIRERARKVLSVRSAVRADYPAGSVFQFGSSDGKGKKGVSWRHHQPLRSVPS